MVNSAGPARSWRIVRTENQVSVARQHAHVITVLVERMLPASLADDPQQNQFARMHVRIAVVGLVRILRRIVTDPCRPAWSGR